MKLKPLQARALRSAINAASRMAGFDLLAAWSGMDPATRGALVVSCDLAASCRALLPPTPPAELADLFAAAGKANELPPQLLEALSWELARYGEDVQAPGASGVMALPGAAVGALPAGEQVHACAAYLRRQADAGHSYTAILAAYAGSLELARRVVGTYCCLIAQLVDLPADTAPDAVALLNAVASAP